MGGPRRLTPGCLPTSPRDTDTRTQDAEGGEEGWTHLLEPHSLTDVDEVQDVLLKARTSESHGSVQELGADTNVVGERIRHLRHISVRGLAQGRDGIDGRHSLCEEGICHELGDFRAPDIGANDALPWNPVGIDARESLDGRKPVFVLSMGERRHISYPAQSRRQVLRG